MPKEGIRSTYSQSPFQIFINDDNGIISTGTGFFYSHNSKIFIITNGHILSGKHFITGNSKDGKLPTYIQLKLATYFEDGIHFTTKAHRIEIYDDCKPLRYEHPLLGSKCDVIALPFEKPLNCPQFMHHPANLISQTKIPIEPGISVFIIGFPKSISVGFGLPIWKSGYIASEPHYDIDIDGKIADLGGLQGGHKLPAFFIDSQTREGMSGSPIFASFTGTWDLTDPFKPINPEHEIFWTRNDVALGGTGREFIGCYSGRIGKTEEAALGLCWKEDVIKEICEARKIAQHPHIILNSCNKSGPPKNS